MDNKHHSEGTVKEPELTYNEVNETILNMLKPPGTGWYMLLFACLFFLAIGASSWFYQMWSGFGESGKSIPNRMGNLHY
jgi:hypothetical protein